MNIYNSEAVKAAVTIRQYLEDQKVPIHGNRAVATWRDGKRDSVSITDKLWHDHVTGQGGSVIDLYILLEGGTPLEAIRTLGDRYKVTPMKTSVKPKRATRGEFLVSQGFALVKSYEYQNADGTPRYWVDRYEKTGEDGQREKEFVQRSTKAENLSGVEKTIYNLPAVIASDRVFVVEGEKDADTINQMGLTGTTNSGGAKFWDAKFNAHFAGKEVIILPDNDAVGQEHARTLMGALAPLAKSVRVCTISKLPKGDVTDWMEREGGSMTALLEAVSAAAQPEKDAPEVAAAKLANATPLVNYRVIKEWNDDKGHKHVQKEPRLVDEICDEIGVRFLGFPKRISGVLFDYTRPKTGRKRKILPLVTKDDFKAWVNGTSRQQSDFQPGTTYATWAEVMARTAQVCPQYEGIAAAPWFPARADVFATYETLPPPDPTHALFDELIGRFLPATDADRTLMRAFFMAPMFFTEGARPAWIIDTVDAQGSGKTTVVKACGWVYGEQPLKFDLKQMDFDSTRIKREILSTEGRQKRIVLFDNVVSALRSGTLADMVTAQGITGMAPYGRTSETRQNDITWCATVNGASVDTDMATRSYTVKIKAPDATADPLWEKKLRSFIEDNRPQLHADILEMLRTAKMRRRKQSRFGEFDAVVLSAAAGADDAAFEAADEAIRLAAFAANDDADLAAQCVEALTNALAAYPEERTGICTDRAVVMKCTDVDEILRKTSGGIRNWTSRTVRKFVNGGHIPNIVKGVDRIPTRAAEQYFGRARCIIFSPNAKLVEGENITVQFVDFSSGLPKVMGRGDARGNVKN